MLKAKKRGAKIIVLDPRKNQIGHWADIYYTFRPGTDVALFNGLMNVIISEGLADQAFIAERTEDFEALKTLVAEYTPERVAEISGVPADGIREIARTYAKRQTCGHPVCNGHHPAHHRRGQRQIHCQPGHAVRQHGRPGGGVNPLRGQNNVQGACDMGGTAQRLPRLPGCHRSRRSRRSSRMPGATLVP
jgi:formate dehydrogenase major subunit